MCLAGSIILTYNEHVLYSMVTMFLCFITLITDFKRFQTENCNNLELVYQNMKRKMLCMIQNAVPLYQTFLSHLWRAYAIPLELSVVHCLSSVVRCVSFVSTITTRNN